MKLRPADARDAPRLAELSGALGYPVAAEAMTSRLARVQARAEHVVLLAESADVIVGWIHAAEREALEAEPRCEILGLVVDAAYRGGGAGRALVAAVEDWAGARGLREMTVSSNVTRVESHPFYERLGYARVKTSHIYRKALPSPG